MQIFFRIVPIYFWFFIIWSVSKILQFIVNQEKTIWEIIWQRSLSYFEEDEYKLFVNGILVTSTIVGISIVSIFSYLDFSQKPAFMRKYKVNPNTNEPPDFKMIRKALIYSTLTGIFLGKPINILAYHALKWREMPSLYPLPSIFTVLITCFINDHIFDVMNYTAHRTLHHRYFYKPIHKMHHEYNSASVAAFLYVHPIEHIFANLLPIASSIVIMKCHIATAWISVMVFMLSSAIAHSGYHLPFLNSPEFHDFHHMKSDSNYCGFGLMDWIFGTDRIFKNTVYQKRDRILLSLKSAHELYPKEKDEKNGKIKLNVKLSQTKE